MSEIPHKPSLRHAAYEAWNGPAFMHEPEESEDSCGGPLVLKVALRRGRTMLPTLYSRSVFVNLFEQDDALVRGMSWEWGQSRVPTAKIARRCVRIPVDLARQWVQSLDAISLTLRVNTDTDDDAGDIRILRHEANYVYNTFELTWQVAQPGSQLDQAWERLWRAMGEELRQRPPVRAVREVFPWGDFTGQDYDVEQVPLDPDT